jgi:hypothetical protein
MLPRSRTAYRAALTSSHNDQIHHTILFFGLTAIQFRFSPQWCPATLQADEKSVVFRKFTLRLPATSTLHGAIRLSAEN